jgi:asparagine synthase (glutamine-hydrolysing)
MCGIAGQLALPGGAPVTRSLMEEMCAALEHRGPDARGLFFDGQVALGIQRLRVVDLLTGDQPVSSEDGAIVVVLNGEIYNYRQLRADLRARGHRFATNGDTEVIAHLYEQHGVECVRHLHGMFAFALWDRRERRLLLARDRVGKKPLFYAAHGGGLAFASELRALLVDRRIRRELDPGAVDCFLAYGYVPAPRAIFAGVSKLPPAHTLVVQDGRMEVSRYWRLDYSRKLSVRDARELHEPIREHVRRATRCRMIADVPLGAFLSGGIDSSAVVAAMAEASDGPVRTFSIGFDRERFDELAHARRIAQLFGTEHHELVVSAEAIATLPRIVRHYGEPFADASAIPSFRLAELARSQVTVALNGDGGDESFGGYTRYVANALAARLDVLPRWLRGTLARPAGRLGGGAESGRRARAHRLISRLALAPAQRYERYVSLLDADRRRALYSAEFAHAVGPAQAGVIADAWGRACGSDVLDVMLEVDSSTYLPGDLLTKIDIATMAHALEARSPLLDHRLMEFAASIPAELKVRGREKKWIFRQALRGWIPDEILDRPKQGFSVPIGDWLRGELRGLAREVLLDPATAARGYFRPQGVRRILAAQAAGDDAQTKPLWALLVFELWHREIVDGVDMSSALGAMVEAVA